jgi:hypothetical protein
MTARKSITNVAAKFTVCALVAAGLALVGCNTETVEISPESKAAQQQSINQESDQTAKSKSGKIVGATVKARTIKQMIKKDAAAKSE